MMLLIYLLILAGTLAARESNVSTSFKTKHITAELVGHSGKIRVYPTAAGNNSYTISIDRIAEVDSASQVVLQVPTLAKSDFTLNGPRQVNNSTAIAVTLSTELQLNSSPLVGLNFTIYLTNSTMKIDNETVNENSLKWTLSITNWPFVDSSNSLRVYISVQTAGGTAVGNSSLASDGKISLGEKALLHFERSVLIDGNQTKALNNLTASWLGESLKVDLSFPSFNSSLLYDPVLSIGPDAEPTHSGGLGVVYEVGIAAGCSILVGITVGVFIDRRRRNAAATKNVVQKHGSSNKSIIKPPLAPESVI